ncbi:hypothetical protein [Hyphomicrobium sp. DY-1]|uniref:hypothetical protein n=1 Tax=Hyphomicrobium sp. DY-1 TaxID=3075650 RepID=UPI0039C1E34D
MQIADRISELQKRAARINLLWTPTCKEAGVSWANVRAWQDGTRSPTVRNLDKTLAALERVIAEHEQKILKDLTSQSVTSADQNERRAS